MSFKQSFTSVMEDAKQAFSDIERTHGEKYMKSKCKKVAYLHPVGYIDGMKNIVAWR